MVFVKFDTVEARGVRDVMRLLDKIQPQVTKDAKKRLRVAARPLVEKSRIYIPDRPLSHWRSWQDGRLDWDAAKVRRGISAATPKARPGRVVQLLILKQRSGPGAIYERAGKKPGNLTPSGRAFIAGLDRIHRPGRAIWRAVDGSHPEIERAIRDGINDMIAAFNSEVSRG